MKEVNDKAYTLDLTNVRVVGDKSKYGIKNRGRIPWNKGKTWEEIYSTESLVVQREKLKKNRHIGHPTKPVIQFDEYGYKQHWYPSSEEAARKTGLDSGNIRKCCRGMRDRCGGFFWKFDENFS